MFTISRPVGLFIACAVVGYGIYAYADSQSEPVKKTTPPAVKKKAIESGDYTDEDYTAHFDAALPKTAVRNFFAPLLRNEGTSTTDAAAAGKDILQVPGPMAGGDSNWIYTGYAVLNGEKTALLENHSTHKSEFVKEGDSWKTSRLVRITPGGITFRDSEGVEATVLRFDPVLASKGDKKETPDLALKPLDPGPALQGQIGPGGPGGPGMPGGPRVMRGGIPQGAQFTVNGATISVGN